MKMNQPQTIREVLDAMDIKFSDESKWTRGWYAKDQDGHNVKEHDPEATCWCLVGCAIAVSPDPSYLGTLSSVGRKTVELFHSLVHNELQADVEYIHHWNDAPNRTFQDVKDLIRLAKERA